ncbi:MAG: hypothetical protein ABI560_02695 [Myxococcales bacterium]
MAPLVLLVTTRIRHYHSVMNQIARMVVSAVSRSPRILKWGAAVGLLCLPTLPACALLANLPGVGGITPPTVTFQGAALAQAPTQKRLGAYYCPDVVPPPLGIPGGATVLCRGLFGARPAPQEMQVAFDLRFRVSNPNKIPVPLADILAAVTVFPAAGNRSLGAACVHLCSPEQPGCNGQPDPAACQSSSRDIRSMADFAGAAANLLITAGVTAAAGQPLTFTAPQVAAGTDLDVLVRYTFGPEEFLGILRQVASQSVNELKAGRSITFNIPFRIEGTVWFDAGSFGRVPVGYGPVEGNWVLPTEGIIPRI